MTRVVLELDDTGLATGYIPVTKVDEKGQRKGQMAVSDVANLLQDVFQWDASRRQVKMISRFDESPFLAWGQNGAKWVSVKAIEPAEYYLVSVSGQAYPVQLPRLVTKVGNHSATFVFWTDAQELTPKSKIYPLMIGNVSAEGRVCLGNTGLKCQTPEDIDQFVRQVIEAPADDTYLPRRTNLDRLLRSLTRRWATGIGRKHGIALDKLLKSEVMG